MDIDSNGYRFILTPEGEMEALRLPRMSYGEGEVEYITDNRDVCNLLLLAVAERMELLLTLIRQEQEARR